MSMGSPTRPIGVRRRSEPEVQQPPHVTSGPAPGAFLLRGPAGVGSPEDPRTAGGQLVVKRLGGVALRPAGPTALDRKSVV